MPMVRLAVSGATTQHLLLLTAFLCALLNASPGRAAPKTVHVPPSQESGAGAPRSTEKPDPGPWQGQAPLTRPQNQAPEPNKSASQLHDRAIWKLKQLDFDGAIADLTEAIQLDPVLAKKIYAKRGIAYAMKGERQSALADLKRAGEINREMKSENCKRLLYSGGTPVAMAAAAKVTAALCSRSARAIANAMPIALEDCGQTVDETSAAFRMIYEQVLTEISKNRVQFCQVVERPGFAR